MHMFKEYLFSHEVRLYFSHFPPNYVCMDHRVQSHSLDCGDEELKAVQDSRLKNNGRATVAIYNVVELEEVHQWSVSY